MPQTLDFMVADFRRIMTHTDPAQMLPDLADWTHTYNSLHYMCRQKDNGNGHYAHATQTCNISHALKCGAFRQRSLCYQTEVSEHTYVIHDVETLGCFPNPRHFRGPVNSPEGNGTVNHNAKHG